MSVNIKENGDLTKVANNISIAQANWNDRNDTTKNTCIKNQPATLSTLEEIAANTDENALAGANAVKELSDSLGGLLKKKTVSITTNENGGVYLDEFNDYTVLNAHSSSILCNVTVTNGRTYFYCFSNSSTGVSTYGNKTLDLTIIYV